MTKTNKEKTAEDLEIEKVQKDAKIKKLKIENKFGDKAKKRLAEISSALNNDTQIIDLTDADFNKFIESIKSSNESDKSEKQDESQNDSQDNLFDNSQDTPY